MASDVILALRAVTRCFIGQQFTSPGVDGGAPINYLVPIAETIPPETMTLSSGESFNEIPGRLLNGEGTREYTYVKERKPELTMSYAAAAPSFDSILVGKQMESVTDYESFVYLEFNATSTTIPAKTSGQSGFSIAAQGANSTANCYYIDPATGLPQTIEIVAASPTGNQMIIGASGAITLSTFLSTSNFFIRCWIPCTYTSATVATSTPIGLLTIFAQGVTYEGQVVEFLARNCARYQGGELGSDKKGTKLAVLPDPNDGTDLGFQIVYTQEIVG